MQKYIFLSIFGKVGTDSMKNGDTVQLPNYKLLGTVGRFYEINTAVETAYIHNGNAVAGDGLSHNLSGHVYYYNVCPGFKSVYGNALFCRIGIDGEMDVRTFVDAVVATMCTTGS